MLHESIYTEDQLVVGVGDEVSVSNGKIRRGLCLADECLVRRIGRGGRDVLRGGGCGLLRAGNVSNCGAQAVAKRHTSMVLAMSATIWPARPVEAEAEGMTCC